MAQSIKEQIVAKILAAIAAIDGIKNVQRVSQAGVAFGAVPFVVLTQGDDLLESPQTPPYTRRKVELVASIITRQTDTADTRSGDEVLNTWGAEVERVLMADRTVGALAEDVKPPEWLEVAIESNVPHLGVALRFAVVYRHLRNDPYRQE